MSAGQGGVERGGKTDGLVVLDLDDPYFDGQTLPDALRDYGHVHSTTGVCVKNAHGSLFITRQAADHG